MQKKEQEIQIRSEEVQEILSYVPNWMIRWGMSLVFAIILMLLIITWFVKYPDIITSEVVVTTVIPPEKIYAHSSGKLDALFVEDNSFVKKNDIIAIIENTANYSDVILLKNIIDTIKVNSSAFYFPIETIPVLILGDIYVDYMTFENNYSNYYLNKKLKPFANEVIAYEMSVIQARQRLGILISQKELNNKEFVFKEKALERQKTLFEKGVISEQEFEFKQLELIQARKNFQNINSQISQLKEALGNSNKNLVGTQIKEKLDEVRLFKNVIQSFFQLKKSIKEWEFKYALKSSISGKVSFLTFWNETQTIKQGDNVFTIIPTKISSFVGKVKAPVRNSGKIKLNQRVNIRLENYPANEFGLLTGTVKNISLIPNNEGLYLIDVDLSNKLVTTYNIQIDFKQEMRGEAEIITKDLRLIERFFYQLKNVFNR
ncbi:HlyD family efflux transporter periplasmic adaptor subunit [Lutibacter sp.]|uniref:HlyD family secretion protein n=1 Tax=Lutibacter sp. TaxID=1925666 RepID=UPI0025BA63BF|nr:HlyD family efflux transporter periplasmic adaptor subunit [Lutibacter sp.]MCF6168846.1 HlyD family secretion protein [Lutibacter sp.]